MFVNSIYYAARTNEPVSLQSEKLQTYSLFLNYGLLKYIFYKVATHLNFIIYFNELEIITIFHLYLAGFA